MAHRTFKDERGMKWDVWSVQPTKVERRLRPGVTMPEERRRQTEYRVTLGQSLANGWLCFENDREKRRLAPIPETWESNSDAELCELLESATVVGPKKRLIE
jgi:hypothetical protein